MENFIHISVADPGFPVGGRRPVGGGANLRRIHTLLGGARAGGAPLDPPMHLVTLWPHLTFHMLTLHDIGF